MSRKKYLALPWSLPLSRCILCLAVDLTRHRRYWGGLESPSIHILTSFQTSIDSPFGVSSEAPKAGQAPNVHEIHARHPTHRHCARAASHTMPHQRDRTSRSQEEVDASSTMSTQQQQQLQQQLLLCVIFSCYSSSNRTQQTPFFWQPLGWLRNRETPRIHNKCWGDAKGGRNLHHQQGPCCC